MAAVVSMVASPLCTGRVGVRFLAVAPILIALLISACACVRPHPAVPVSKPSAKPTPVWMDPQIPDQAKNAEKNDGPPHYTYNNPEDPEDHWGILNKI